MDKREAARVGLAWGERLGLPVRGRRQADLRDYMGPTGPVERPRQRLPTELDAALAAIAGSTVECAPRAGALVAAVEAVLAETDPIAAAAAEDRVVGHALRRVLPKLTSDLDAAREAIVDAARPHLGDRFSRVHPNQPFVLLGGVHALAVALAPGIDPGPALLSVVRLGEAADVVGALTGALLAARFGTNWIPQKLE